LCQVLDQVNSSAPLDLPAVSPSFGIDNPFVVSFLVSGQDADEKTVKRRLNALMATDAEHHLRESLRKMKLTQHIIAAAARCLVLIALLTPALAAGGNHTALAAASATQHVYVHYDYMVAADGRSDAPDPISIQLVVEAFAAHGIELYVDPKHAAIPEHKVIIP